MKKENLKFVSVKFSQNNAIMFYHQQDDTKKYSVEATDTPHPDMSLSLLSLREHMADIHYIGKKNIENINITGYGLSGNEYNSIILTGTLETPSGKVVSINSEKISIEAELYGWEKELEKKIADINDEAFNYFFKNKKAQQDIELKEEE